MMKFTKENVYIVDYPILTRADVTNSNNNLIKSRLHQLQNISKLYKQYLNYKTLANYLYKQYLVSPAIFSHKVHI